MEKMIMLIAAFSLCIVLAITAAAQTVTDFEFDTVNWVLPDNCQTTEFEGNQSLLIETTGIYEYYLRDSYAYLKDFNFSDGLIEFDIYCPSANEAYVGFFFRFTQYNEEDRYELFYFRPFISNTMGAVQYFPVNNGVANFQYYSDLVYQSAGNIPYNRWNHVKAEINGPGAVVYINDSEVMTVKNLARGFSEGSIGLWMDNTTPRCYYANFRVTTQK